MWQLSWRNIIKTTTITPELDDGFAQLARERTARHPLRTYLQIPLRRAVSIWFTPRIDLTPLSGRLWPPGEQWKEDPLSFAVTVALVLLNLFYLELALIGAEMVGWFSGGVASRIHSRPHGLYYEEILSAPGAICLRIWYAANRDDRCARRLSEAELGRSLRSRLGSRRFRAISGLRI